MTPTAEEMKKMKAEEWLFLNEAAKWPTGVRLFKEEDVRTLIARIQELEAENARLLSGRFTPEEFQNFCHSLNEHDKEAFCQGCEEYQKKLFGTSPIAELRREVEELKRNIDPYGMTLKVGGAEVVQNPSPYTLKHSGPKEDS